MVLEVLLSFVRVLSGGLKGERAKSPNVVGLKDRLEDVEVMPGEGSGECLKLVDLALIGVIDGDSVITGDL